MGKGQQHRKTRGLTGHGPALRSSETESRDRRIDYVYPVLVPARAGAPVSIAAYLRGTRVASYAPGPRRALRYRGTHCW